MSRRVVSTPELREGEIVLTHEMLVELRNRSEHRDPPSPVVIHFDGLVLNPDEVDTRVIGVGMRSAPWYVTEEYERGTYWAIQGNHLARWTVEGPE